MSLLDLKRPRSRFARSINVERDGSVEAIDGYLPVGRAVDTITRLVRALDRPDGEVALSITGPYGSGKSSLGVMIDALLSPADNAARRSAEELLEAAAPHVVPLLHQALHRYDAYESGFVRAVVTARREPIAATVVRSMLNGVQRFEPAQAQRSQHRAAAKAAGRLHAAYVEGHQLPETREIREVLQLIAELAPVLLLVDEFGKNLEAFADSQNDGDLYLLQELAELTRGSQGMPLALVTLQHMAFDEYTASATAAQRREWAKIQGRFEDIPYVDSPSQTRALIGEAFELAASPLAESAAKWAREQGKELKRAGLIDLAGDVDLLNRCWPLHPLSLAVLPTLCERYGQNERTLFSFLAGNEPRSVTTFLAENDWVQRSDLPTVRLDRVYDYFLESATTMVAVSTSASRWLEIDTRIRDAHGVDPASLRVLKTVGVLNLVSAGGALRASGSLVALAATDGQPGSSTPEDIEQRLADLESRGLLTFRDFADEYRVWQGTDFDLRAAIDRARHRVRHESAASILQAVLPVEPIVAARHSHTTGTLRAFQPAWVDPDASELVPLGSGDRADGTLFYVVGDTAPTDSLVRRTDERPVVFITTQDPTALVDAAREVAAIDEVLESTDDLTDDWVARRELLERRVEANIALHREFQSAFGAGSRNRGTWTWTGRKRRNWKPLKAASLSSALSTVADTWYEDAPVVRNDLVNRHDLSSQAAKARRELLDATLSGVDRAELGIEGFGPNKTMYLSVLKALGLHRPGKGNIWELTEPEADSSVRPVWDALAAMLLCATEARLRIDDIYEQLAAPPFGVRPGIAPILVTVALSVFADDMALYEHGTFRPVISSQIIERLLRNPANFEVKCFAARKGKRAQFLADVATRLAIPDRGRAHSVVSVVSHLVMSVNRLPEFSLRTSTVSSEAQAMRQQIVHATEPDDLIFRAVPEALGRRPVEIGTRLSEEDLSETAHLIHEVVRELENAFPRLLGEIQQTLYDELRVRRPESEARQAITERSREIEAKVIDARVARLIVALTADIPDQDGWLQYAAQNIVGDPPEGWADDDRRRFLTVAKDVCAAFCRVEALNADLRTHGEGFDAVRVTLTRPDGTESIKLVWLDEARRESIADLVEEAVAKVAERTTSEGLVANATEQARELLLAALANLEIDAKAEAELTTSRIGEDSYTGADERQSQKGHTV